MSQNELIEEFARGKLTDDRLLEYVAVAVRQLRSSLTIKNGSSGLYIIGNTRDFNHVAQPVIDKFGNAVVGISSFWSEASENPIVPEQLMFRLPCEYIGRSKADTPDLLFIQAFVTSAREVRAMISRVLSLLPVRNIEIAALAITEEAENELRDYFSDDSLDPVIISSFAQVSRSSNPWRIQNDFYRNFESALGPTASMMPRTLLEGLRGKKPYVPPPTPLGGSRFSP